MKAGVTITLKPGLLDAQGKSVKSALESLGFKGVKDVRVGKYVEILLNGTTAQATKQELERMCKKLLANPVIETYHVEFAPGSGLRAPRKTRQPSAPNHQPPAK